jgi:hypothetical protein
MSELIIKQSARGNARWNLLATVSAMAICGAGCAVPAFAGDADHSTVWIELGAQVERTQGGQDPFLPPFLQSSPRPAFEDVPSASTQRPPRYAIGGEGKITLSPEGSDWSLSADVRYGRSNGAKHLHQQTTEIRKSGVHLLTDDPVYVRLTGFGDTASAHKASYLVADFVAGRDVGLGLWRGASSAVVDFGVRFVQFTSKNTTTLRELPDPFVERVPRPSPFLPNAHKYATNTHHHSFYAQSSVWHSFSGVGPTISMNGSQAFAGNPDEGELSFDWGINGAVLFGRQKVHGSHKTTGEYFTNHFTAFGFAPKSTYSPPPKSIARTRSVVVPNVGGFAGLSVRRANAKVSFGYRADFFFGAMDAGIDARRTETMSFHGPFVSLSVGLGG